jgi:hypothetical protein
MHGSNMGEDVVARAPASRGAGTPSQGEAESVPTADDAWKMLGELLVANGMLSQAELEDALAEQAESGKRLGEILLACDLISRPGLGTALTEQEHGEVTTESESGFGTGLRAAMEISHRGRRPRPLGTAPANRLEAPQPAA